MLALHTVASTTPGQISELLLIAIIPDYREDVAQKMMPEGR